MWCFLHQVSSMFDTSLARLNSKNSWYNLAEKPPCCTTKWSEVDNWWSNLIIAFIINPQSPCIASFSDPSNPSGDHTELFSLPPSGLDGGAGVYLNQAAVELTAAMEREKEGELSGAIRGYRTAVDILITGVQGEKMRKDIKQNKVFLSSATCHVYSCMKDEPAWLLWWQTLHLQIFRV